MELLGLTSQEICLDFHAFQTQHCTRPAKQVTGDFNQSLHGKPRGAPGRGSLPGRSSSQGRPGPGPGGCMVETEQAPFQSMSKFTEHIYARYFRFQTDLRGNTKRRYASDTHFLVFKTLCSQRSSLTQFHARVGKAEMQSRGFCDPEACVVGVFLHDADTRHR